MSTVKGLVLWLILTVDHVSYRSVLPMDPFKKQITGFRRGYVGLWFGDNSPKMQEQTENNMEHEMETWILQGIIEINISHVFDGHGLPLGKYEEHC